MHILRCEQYSHEWWAARLGRPTASRFAKIVGVSGKPMSSWSTEVFRCAAEIVTQQADETPVTVWMKRGLDLEPEAREAYEFLSGNNVEHVGLVYSGNRLASCSPDGLGSRFGLEIKCPAPTTQAKYLFDGKLPDEYRPQVWGSLWCCDETDRWEFFSYHPAMPPLMVSVGRGAEYAKYAAALDELIPKFAAEVHQIVAKIAPDMMV